ncbi:hypothetical protein [Paralimibaculum aggregatum]|nr:hypothetical protein [Limibaculum sp. NKW23]
MIARVGGGAMDLVTSIIDGGVEKWNEGLVPFFTSPYGIAVLFLVLFLFLNSMRMRL